MGRPPKEIPAEAVESLAAKGCKTQEIADIFNCSTDTIERRFAAELQKGRANLKLSLRQWQLDSAKKGNAVMQIWLGKQLLGQINDVCVLLAEISDEDLSDEINRRITRRQQIESPRELVEIQSEVLSKDNSTATDSGQELSKAVSVYRGSGET